MIMSFAVRMGYWSTLRVRAEREIDGHFVEFSLGREAVVTGVGQKGQPFVVGEHGFAEARRSALQSNKSLGYTAAS